MAQSVVAKLFYNGRSQAVRLPKAFRFSGERVQIRKVPGGILLEPLCADDVFWFEELDRCGADLLLPEGRQQPPAPVQIYFP